MNVRISSKDEQSLAQENAALRKENAILKEQLALLQEQFDWLRKQVFGRKTEQTSVIMDGGTQLELFPDEKEQAVSVPEKTITVPEHQRKAKRTYKEWMSSLPIKEERHEEEQPVCEKCGSEMVEIGEEKAYDELVFVPGEFFVRRHIVKKYKCTKCGQDPEKDAQNPDEIERCTIRCADYPKPMIPHSFCSPELAAHIIYEKFAKAVPLYRQEKDFASKGIPILRATMSEWVCMIAERWCLPILEEMHKRLLLPGIIHGDETVVQVLHEADRKATTDSRMWVYCNGKMNDRSIIIFEYQQTRGGVHPAKFLKGFTGFLICDGYDAYNAVTGTKRCGCWTHTRRHFVEALPKDKSAYSTSVAAKAVSFCDSIYHEEKKLAVLKDHGDQFLGQFLSNDKVEEIWLVKYIYQDDDIMQDTDSVNAPWRGLVFKFSRNDYEDSIEEMRNRIILFDKMIDAPISPSEFKKGEWTVLANGQLVKK